MLELGTGESVGPVGCSPPPPLLQPQPPYSTSWSHTRPSLRNRIPGPKLKGTVDRRARGEESSGLRPSEHAQCRGKRRHRDALEFLPQPMGPRVLTPRPSLGETVGPSSLQAPDFQVKSQNAAPLTTLHSSSTPPLRLERENLRLA